MMMIVTCDLFLINRLIRYRGRYLFVIKRVHNVAVQLILTRLIAFYVFLFLFIKYVCLRARDSEF